MSGELYAVRKPARQVKMGDFVRLDGWGAYHESLGVDQGWTDEAGRVHPPAGQEDGYVKILWDITKRENHHLGPFTMALADEIVEAYR